MDNFDEIKRLAGEMMKLYDLKYDIVKPEVIAIISNRVKNPKIIERCLDETLDIPTDKGYKLHSLLCNYYSTIDVKSAKWYLEEYNIFWNVEEEKEEEWKNIKK